MKVGTSHRCACRGQCVTSKGSPFGLAGTLRARASFATVVALHDELGRERRRCQTGTALSLTEERP
jgi:hypothetical protein